MCSIPAPNPKLPIERQASKKRQGLRKGGRCIFMASYMTEIKTKKYFHVELAKIHIPIMCKTLANGDATL